VEKSKVSEETHARRAMSKARIAVRPIRTPPKARGQIGAADRKTGSQLRPAAERRLPRKIEREFANIVGGAGPKLSACSRLRKTAPLAVCVQGIRKRVLLSRKREGGGSRSGSEFVVLLLRESRSPIGLSRRTERSRDSNALIGPRLPPTL
jgi:hypothetical protein